MNPAPRRSRLRLQCLRVHSIPQICNGVLVLANWEAAAVSSLPPMHPATQCIPTALHDLCSQQLSSQRIFPTTSFGRLCSSNLSLMKPNTCPFLCLRQSGSGSPWDSGICPQATPRCGDITHQVTTWSRTNYITASEQATAIRISVHHCNSSIRRAAFTDTWQVREALSFVM